MSKIQTGSMMGTDELLVKLTERSCSDIYEKVVSDQDLHQAFSSFLLEQPIYLSVDVGTAYVVHSLLVNGDSYANKLMDDLAETRELRLSDTVFSQILDSLIQNNMVVTYTQKAHGQISGDTRGRPRTMIQLSVNSYYAASELAEHWEDFLDSPRTFRMFISGEQYNTRLEATSPDINKTLDFLASKPQVYLNGNMALAYVVHSLIVNGDSYGQKLLDDLNQTEKLRASDTVIGRVIEILIRTKIVNTYEQKAQGEISGDHRGRNRIMLKINLDSYDLACELVEYWEDFLLSTSIYTNPVLEQSDYDRVPSGKKTQAIDTDKQLVNCPN